jgi:hypothetical protein
MHVKFGSTTIPESRSLPKGDDYATRNMAPSCVKTPTSPGASARSVRDIPWTPQTGYNDRPTARNKEPAPLSERAGPSYGLGSLFDLIG